MDGAWTGGIAARARLTGISGALSPSPPGTRRRPPVLDVLYIGLVIVVFAALWLLIRGVERFER